MKILDFTNWLNVLLMLVSLFLSLFIPFELFLLAYAILGPLHYLTEISWLHDRNYFLKEKTDAWFFVIIAVVVLLSALSAFWGILPELAAIFSPIIPALLFSGVVFAVGVIFFSKSWQKIGLFVGSFWLVVLTGWQGDPVFKAWFATLLPTMIHVLIFKGAFILVGTLKSKSLSGAASLLFFIVCLVLALFLPAGIIEFPNDFVLNNYPQYFGINRTLGDLLGFGRVENFSDLFVSNQAIAVMRLIAFSYTYHYLNWFSKTSIIKWQNVSRMRWMGILFLWVIAVALYLADYRLGFMALYLLSMLHVFLEFPLNAITFGEIGKLSLGFFRNSANRN
jgi:hypothetical protein